MKAITSDEMRELESFAVGLGIPSRILMEIAGMKVANIALQEVKKAASVCVICGSGGNGGDGFVSARYLHNAGIKTDVFLVSPENKISSSDSIENLKILKNLKIRVHDLSSDESFNEFRKCIIASDIVLDAIFGIGGSGEIKGTAVRAIDLMNDLKKEIKDRRPYAVVSVDVPSGVDASTGEIASQCVEADITVTFESPKIGLFKYPASKYAGKIITASIGIPAKDTAQIDIAPDKIRPKPFIEGIQVTDASFIQGAIPRRKIDANKGDCGKVLIIAGSSGMMGAAVLTASSALRTGSGLVTLCVPDNIKDMVNSMSLETVVAGFSDIESKLEECDVIAVGPGLSKGKEIDKLVKGLILSRKLKVPIVIDADGLNAISDPSVLKGCGKEIIITPHPGEFARLTGKTVEDIQRDRTGITARFSSEYGVTTVLKGAFTVIAGSGKIFINPTGNPGMASAGVGDVLTGIIASLIGQGTGTFNSAVAGVFIHGMAGNFSVSMKGQRGIIASDIMEAVPYTLDSLI